jgi:hypothetical protein
VLSCWVLNEDHLCWDTRCTLWWNLRTVQKVRHYIYTMFKNTWMLIMLFYWVSIDQFLCIDFDLCTFIILWSNNIHWSHNNTVTISVPPQIPVLNLPYQLSFHWGAWIVQLFSICLALIFHSRFLNNCLINIHVYKSVPTWKCWLYLWF